MRTIACRRSHLARVSGQITLPFPFSLLEYLGWTSLAVGAGIFASGLSGGIGLGLMTMSAGVLIAQSSEDQSMSNAGFFLLLGGPIAAYWLYQTPSVNRWYDKTFRA